METVNVKCFGAIGDGVTDDTAAIQAAIVAAAATFHTVSFPAGTYLVSKNAAGAYCFAPPANMRFEGIAGLSVLKLAPAQSSSVRIFTLHNVQQVAFSNLVLDGSRAGQTVDEHKHGIFIWESSGISIENVECREFMGDGISLFTGCSDITIRDCHIHGCERDGIAFTGGNCQRITVENCHIHAIAAQPIDSEPDGSVNNVRLLHNTLEAAVTQFALTCGGHDATHLNDGWVIDGNAIVGSVDVIRCKNLRLVNNVIDATGNSNDAVNGRYHSENVLIAHNTIKASDKAAVSLTAASGEIPTNWIVDGNTITKTGAGNAVLVWGGRSLRLANNTIVGSGAGYGVNLYSTTPADCIMIHGNWIRAVAVGLYFAVYSGNDFSAVVLADNVIDAPTGLQLIGTAADYPRAILRANVLTGTINNLAGVVFVGQAA